MTREGAVAYPVSLLETLVARFGGDASPAFSQGSIVALAAIESAVAGDLSLCATAIHVASARRALEAGAFVLATPDLAARLADPARVWTHAHAAWAFAMLTAAADYVLPAAVVPDDAVIEPGAQVLPGVRLGRGVRIGAGSIVGRAGFGFVVAPDGTPHPVPHVGGVILGDHVSIGAYCTVDAGVLLPTRIGAHSKLDSHVHVGHNVVLGQRVLVAAQAGFAGSVTVGDDVQVGGQAGIADHVHVGAGARIAAKAGVIGDVPAGSTFAGYPAVARARWLRGHARLYRGTSS